MRLNRLVFAAGFTALVATYATYAQYSNPGNPSSGGAGGTSPGAAGGAANNAPITCPLSSSLLASISNCVTVVIPPNAAGMGPAAFGVNPLNVSLGTTIIWYNQDSVTHTVTANDGSFDSGPLAPGEYFSKTFNNPGSVPYFCAIHGQLSMSGTINVSSVKASPLPCPPQQGMAPTPGATTFVPVPVPVPVITPTQRPSVRPSRSPSPSPSPSVSPSPSPSPSVSPSPTVTPSASPSRSPAPSGRPSVTPTPSATPYPTGSPTTNASPRATPSPSPSRT